MSQLSPELEKIIRTRLLYYRDLGVYDFYRRSEPELPVAQEAVVPESEALLSRISVDAGSASPTSIAPDPPSNFQPDPEPTIPSRKPVGLPPDFISTILPAAERPAAMDAIRKEIGDCTRCPLAFQGRHKIVFADGDPNARLMFVGEGPGADEDAQGLPFVGRAGQLLNNMINAMGLQREQVYIANVVKCRPPQNRTPEPEEANTCMQFLWQQIDVVKPEVLVALGSTAATYLLGRKASLSSLRGRIHDLRGSKLIVTYHPAYLLRDPSQKKEAWKDLQMAMAELGLTMSSGAAKKSS
jgi:uracil-DNA glycosylase family 4